MALPTSGNITLAQVNTELGNSSSAAISLNNTNVRNLANKPSGAISMTDLYGATWIVISANTTNVNLFTLAGSPTTARRVIVTINAGVTVGATAGNTAFTVGQFPTGSTIQINNNGSIQGYGGTAGTSTTGGSGGDALNANYPNQTVVINNNTGATIYGGGGGGGKAGSGGTGGTGGQGQYSSVVNQGCAGSSCVTYYYFSNCNTLCQYFYGGSSYCWANCRSGSFDYGIAYRCDNCGYNVTTYTSGGAGGGGGAGGNGGVGQGYGQTNTNGSTGTAGSAGSAGGTNAGAGGTGGTGGTGGNGGTWGNAGANGATGNTGSTGANGNYTNGSAGSAGAGGYSGGSAGRYLVKGSNSVTLNNSGTVAGGLA